MQHLLSTAPSEALNLISRILRHEMSDSVAGSKRLADKEEDGSGPARSVSRVETGTPPIIPQLPSVPVTSGIVQAVTPAASVPTGVPGVPAPGPASGPASGPGTSLPLLPPLQTPLFRTLLPMTQTSLMVC
jgi:hypothetical protein